MTNHFTQLLLSFYHKRAGRHRSNATHRRIDCYRKGCLVPRAAANCVPSEVAATSFSEHIVVVEKAGVAVAEATDGASVSGRMQPTSSVRLKLRVRHRSVEIAVA